MHLILTGATGLVGSATLYAMVRNANVSRVSIFARSPVEQATDSDAARSKCTVHVHDDFSSPPSREVLSALGDAHGCIWALGVSTNEVDSQTYDKITVDWPVAWARAFAEAGLGSQGHRFKFVYVSGEGATQNPGLMTPRFGRVKGRAEQALLDLADKEGGADFNAYAARAGAVDRADHPEIAPYTAHREGIQKKLEGPVRAVLRSVGASIICPTKPLGEALIKLAAGDAETLDGEQRSSGSGRILGNVALQKLSSI
jgi:hypothetical protein